MFTIAKGMLGGAWALMVGWILPSAISLLLFGLLVLPSMDQDFAEAVPKSLGEDGTILLVAAVVLGWFLSALSTSLYQVLEGYLVWPDRLKEAMKERQRHLRKAEARKAGRKAASGSLEGAWADQRLDRRYPRRKDQFLPTRFGNAIRSFEFYGEDRYELDAVRLWPHLSATASESVTKEVEEARTQVDFFVCLSYTQVMLGLSGLMTMAVQRQGEPQLAAAVGIGFVGAGLSYRGAIAATVPWADAVRAVVDLGRLPLAAALGLCIPDRLEDERRMWQTLCWTAGYPYRPEGAAQLDEFRVRHPVPADPDHPTATAGESMQIHTG